MRGIGSALLLAVIYSGSVSAAGNSHGLAGEYAFDFNGKPIDPRCVARLVSIENGGLQIVDLSDCAKQMRGKSAVKQRGRSLEAEDAVPGSGGQFESASYEILGENAGRFIASTEWSGGGTGRFTNLLIVRKESGKIIAEKSLSVGGDRCNGGLADNRMSGAMVHWSVYLTPFDLIDLGGIKSLAAYKDLEASAASCAATQNWEYDFDTDKTRFVSVMLEPSAAMGSKSGLIQDQSGWTENYTYQHCFNGIYDGFITRRRTDLSPSELIQFAQDFARVCLTKKS